MSGLMYLALFFVVVVPLAVLAIGGACMVVLRWWTALIERDDHV